MRSGIQWSGGAVGLLTLASNCLASWISLFNSVRSNLRKSGDVIPKRSYWVRRALISSSCSSMSTCLNSSVRVERMCVGGARGLEDFLGVGVVSKSLLRSQT